MSGSAHHLSWYRLYSLIILIDARQITPTPAEYIQTGIQPDQANRESNNDAEQMDDFSGQWNQAIDANQQTI